MSVDRRQFAILASASFGFLAVPAALEVWAMRRRLLPDPSGRPLLALHVPDDEDAADAFGTLFGIFLLRATDAECAWLAGCDLACASTRELHRWGVDPRGVHAAILSAVAEPTIALAGPAPFADYREQLPGETESVFDEDAIERRFRERFPVNHAWIALQLAVALGPGTPLADLACARERSARGELDENEVPSFERAVATPFLVRERIARRPQERAEWNRRLTASVRDRWGSVAPKDSTWTFSGGCGHYYEVPPPHYLRVSGTCGNGHVPEPAQRFLHFYTEAELHGA